MCLELISKLEQCARSFSLKTDDGCNGLMNLAREFSRRQSIAAEALLEIAPGRAMVVLMEQSPDVTS